MSQVTLIIPESLSPEGSSEEQRISLEGFELTTNLFSFWRSRSAEISATRLTVDKIEISDFSSPIEIRESVVLPDIKASLWQGAVEAYAQINTHTHPLTIETRGKLKDADATSLLAAMADLGAAQGKLSAGWDLAAVLPEAENDLAKLNGQIVINGDQVTLAQSISRGECALRLAVRREREVLSGTRMERCLIACP